jgi:hypothetical protein
MKRIIITLLALTLLVSLAVAGVGCKCFECICGNPSIDVEVDISVGCGETWMSADTLAAGPEVDVNYQLKYRYVVTNTGDVTLENITLTDSTFDFDGSVPIVSPLPPGASFEGVLWYNWAESQAIRADEGGICTTATATGDYRGITYSDSDDACYTGIPLP